MDTGWHFQVERVNLGGIGIDAGQELGMVIVQPDYELVLDGAVPFRISGIYRAIQIELIEKAFMISAVESQERNISVPFILFPEVAIPGNNPDGLECIRQQMERTQGDLIFIGGLEGLTPQELEQTVDRYRPSVDVAMPEFDTAGAFVNVCVIAVKSNGGELAWHYQAKLAPSRWEQGRNMARGRRLLHFRAFRLAFICQICFDYIATQGIEALNTFLLKQLIEMARPDAAALNFVFVPQCNPSPNVECVRNNTSQIFRFEDAQLSNHLTSVVMINKAANVQESLEFGRSGFHYKPGRWQLPVSDIGPKGYELYDLNNITSAVFRKRTQAIHVATWIPPSRNICDSGNPRQPLENPKSYLIEAECDPTPCLCAHDHTSSAGAFVVCDCLPCKLLTNS